MTKNNLLLPWQVVEELLRPLNLNQSQQNTIAYTLTVAIYKNILEFLFLYRSADKSFIKNLTTFFDSEIHKIDSDQISSFSSQLQKSQLEIIGTFVEKLYQAGDNNQKISILNNIKSIIEEKPDHD